MSIGEWVQAVRTARQLNAIRDEAIRARDEAILLRSEADELIEDYRISRSHYETVIAELKQVVLQSQRSCLHIAIAARIAMDDPSTDIREDLDAMIDGLGNDIACLEEQVVS